MRAAAALALLVACGSDAAPMTPESIVSDAAEGDVVDFEATVHTLTRIHWSELDRIPVIEDAAVEIVGSPYKDPAHAGGGLADPEKDSRVIAVGTYRYDDDHGWFEVHPVKAYFPTEGP